MHSGGTSGNCGIGSLWPDVPPYPGETGVSFFPQQIRKAVCRIGKRAASFRKQPFLLAFYNVSWNYSGALQQGSTGEYVRQLQYMLQVLAEFIPAIPPVNVDGIYGPATQSAVLAAQRYFGLPQTGTVDERTWQLLESQFNGVRDTVFRDGELFPEGQAVTASTGPAPQGRYENTTTLTQFPGFDLRLGSRDEPQREA